MTDSKLSVSSYRQGSVWSSLKCTTMMDTLNHIVMSNEDLQYFYKGDKNIPIGVRGMVDDTLGISKCGRQAVHINSVINSSPREKKVHFGVFLS